MRATKQFEEECRQFLLTQIEIVQPFIVVALGDDAHPRVKLVDRRAPKAMHPSAREFNLLKTRADNVALRATELRAAVENTASAT